MKCTCPFANLVTVALLSLSFVSSSHAAVLGQATDLRITFVILTTRPIAYFRPIGVSTFGTVVCCLRSINSASTWLLGSSATLLLQLKGQQFYQPCDSTLNTEPIFIYLKTTL
jgi:hypothetical protein